ncbi:family 20 glycosylhydrolase, partial [Flavobacteriales bacterium]|nr:family 20 glycosylhydrolase [Flavobacteriales bacterium]
RIHIGGDEAPKVRWSSCKKCQRRMAQEGLQDEEELQRWFIERMGQYLASKGKTIIGWDEILEGGLPEGAAVQSWRGMGGAAEAVHLGADVIVSPTSHCYLDYPLRSTDLEEAYSFNPLPDSLSHGPGRILGGEGNMWTEHAPQVLVESKVYPRLTALSEVYWSGPNRTTQPKAYTDFLARLDAHYVRLDAMDVDYGLESPPFALETAAGANGALSAEVIALGRGVTGRGLWTGTDADSVSSGVSFEVRGPGEVVMEVGRRGKWTGQQVAFPLDGHAAGFKPLMLSYAPSPWYTGGGNGALVDGKLGSSDFRDGAWQAQQGVDMTATVDLGAPQTIEEVATGVYLYQDAWIFLPASVLWEGSEDGKQWSTLARIAPGDVLARDDRQQRMSLKAVVRPGAPQAQFVRMKVTNAGPCPDWHAAAGSESWLFLDEITVR